MVTGKKPVERDEANVHRSFLIAPCGAIELIASEIRLLKKREVRLEHDHLLQPFAIVIFSQLSQTSALVLLFSLLCGLGLSFVFRHRCWGVFIWFPTTAVFVYAAFNIIRILSSIGKMRGPEAGFAGMMAIFLLPALSICLLGLIAAFFCRPRKEAWRLSAIIPAIVLWLGAALLIDDWNSTRVEVRLSDTRGNILSGVGIQEHLHENGLKMSVQSLNSDAQGKFSFRLHPNQSVALEIQPMSDPPGDLQRKPTFWNLSFREQEGHPDKLVVRNHWQRSIGGQVLNEGFSEVIPNTPKISMELVLPDHGALDPTPRQKRIRDAFDAFVKDRPPGLDYPSMCRNVEAIEFIPDLLAAYRSKPEDRMGIVEGLSQIAGILSQLDLACRSVPRNIPRAGTKKPPTLSESLQYQITQFCTWAKVPLEGSPDPGLAMEKVKAKIDAIATQLTEFALAEMSDDSRSLNVLSELRQLGKPAIPQLVDAIRRHPPKNRQEAYSQHHTLWMIGAKFSDLTPLYASDDPSLVMTAFEATPNEELEGPIAAEALARLEAVYPRIPEESQKKRAEMHMNMLRARLKREP